MTTGFSPPFRLGHGTRRRKRFSFWDMRSGFPNDLKLSTLIKIPHGFPMGIPCGPMGSLGNSWEIFRLVIAHHVTPWECHGGTWEMMGNMHGVQESHGTPWGKSWTPWEKSWTPWEKSWSPWECHGGTWDMMGNMHGVQETCWIHVPHIICHGIFMNTPWGAPVECYWNTGHFGKENSFQIPWSIHEDRSNITLKKQINK